MDYSKEIDMSALIIDTDMTGDLPVVKVIGRVDSETAPELDDALSRLLEGEQYKIVLNLQDVDFLSSAGLRAIVKAYQTAQKSGGDVRLAAISEPIEVILRTVGMMQMLKMYPSNQEAIASF
jgi:anti-sigma B factor antagonist